MPRPFTVAALAAALALGTAACGGARAPNPPSSTSGAPTAANNPIPAAPAPTAGGVPVVAVEPKREVATGSTLTEFQRSRLLGHYSTLDGASGFILDRTVVPWRAKLDGVNRIVTMAESNEPRRGVKDYTSDDKSIWIRIDEDGHVQLFQGPKQHEGVYVRRDADAEQLK